LTGGVDLTFGLAGWFWLVCIAVVSTVVAMLTFFAGLRRTGPSTAAILSTFEPVVTTALAGLTLDEFLTPAQLAGALLVLSSVVVLIVRPARNGQRLPDAKRKASAFSGTCGAASPDSCSAAEVGDLVAARLGREPAAATRWRPL
jgi:hypothetical protein